MRYVPNAIEMTGVALRFFVPAELFGGRHWYEPVLHSGDNPESRYCI